MSRRGLLLLLVAVVVAGSVTAGIAVAGKGNGNDKTFQYAIGLWGDLPYSDVQAQVGVPNLIADMNNADIQFSIHDGDLKAGSATAGSATPTTCADALYTQALGFFNSLQQPAIFTPGDNDWVDCDRLSNGPAPPNEFNATERLQHERGLFFSGPYADRSLGMQQLKQEVQTAPLCVGWDYNTNSEVPNQPCVENRRWVYKGVVYATVNIQGTCNNLCKSGSAADPSTGDANGDPAEFQAREAADELWLQQTFDEAKATNAAGVMIVGQADPGFDKTDATRGPVRDPKTLAETDGQPDGFQAFLVETAPVDNRLRQAGGLRPRRLALLPRRQAAAGLERGAHRELHARRDLRRQPGQRHERRQLGEGTDRPEEPRRLRLPDADGARERGAPPAERLDRLHLTGLDRPAAHQQAAGPVEPSSNTVRAVPAWTPTAKPARLPGWRLERTVRSAARRRHHPVVSTRIDNPAEPLSVESELTRHTSRKCRRPGRRLGPSVETRTARLR